LKIEGFTREQIDRREFDRQVKARDDALFLALQREADPLYLKSRRGEATEEEWVAKVAEVKARYPKPVFQGPSGQGGGDGS